MNLKLLCWPHSEVCKPHFLLHRFYFVKRRQLTMLLSTTILHHHWSNRGPSPNIWSRQCCIISQGTLPGSYLRRPLENAIRPMKHIECAYDDGHGPISLLCYAIWPMLKKELPTWKNLCRCQRIQNAHPNVFIIKGVSINTIIMVCDTGHECHGHWEEHCQH